MRLTNKDALQHSKFIKLCVRSKCTSGAASRHICTIRRGLHLKKRPSSMLPTVLHLFEELLHALECKI